MKFAVSSRQTPEYIEKADEINVQYRDREYIFDLIEKYPDKKHILDASDEYSPDWTLIKQFATLSPNFILRVSKDYHNMVYCAEEGIPFFAGYPINDWAVMHAYKELGPVYVIPAGELFFSLDRLQKFGIPIRICANRPYLSQILLETDTPIDISVVSEWVRPDDIEYYEEFVDAIEFADIEPEKERALYRIYAEQKHWPGSLRYIINNLKTDATCRLIDPVVFTLRMTCGRKCLAQHACRVCFRAFSLADEARIREYKETVLDKS